MHLLSYLASTTSLLLLLIVNSSSFSSFFVSLKRVCMGGVSMAAFLSSYILEAIPTEGCLPLVISMSEWDEYALVSLCTNPHAQHLNLPKNGPLS